MFANAVVALTDWSKSAGSSGMKLLALLAILLGGIWSDVVATTILPCKTVNAIRSVIGMAPLICLDDRNTIIGSTCRPKPDKKLDAAYKPIQDAVAAVQAVTDKPPSFWIYCK
jgi:hypothetical protein